ncbi:pimeloyl-ACP methyl ester carboxylesterase [Alkalihalobacillus xiaoxiensis]|uniref:Pimeloyl-ACP methyl ester carboxylesterase n=1 Tax=Shouchella xiaoxiensis TaxID=766895 RepID=A0ABS2SUP8_9BACI|nr:pimeloyl-ACP methyl ester carboxylesterase [Shouchella xiaoxiensis]
MDGLRLYYLKEGSGQPLVFLHGAILCADDFSESIKAASHAGFQAIAFDRPGYGKSKRDDRLWTPEKQAALIKKALSKLNIKDPILVAHSWSGAMALSYARQYPNEVKGVALVAAAIYKEGYPAEHGEPVSTLLAVPVIGKLILMAICSTFFGWFLANGMLKATFAPEKPPSNYGRLVYNLGLTKQQFLANRQDVQLFAQSAFKESKHYSRIETPVFILTGEQDPFGVNEQAKRLMSELPHAKGHQLNSAGHMIPHLHAERMIQLIKEHSVKAE